MVISLGRGDYKGGYVVACAAVIGEDVRNDLIKIFFKTYYLRAEAAHSVHSRPGPAIGPSLR